MPDVEMIKALCCLGGADTDVTVEEIQLLGNLAGHVGIERSVFNAEVEKTRNEETIRARHLEAATRDAPAAMGELVKVARDSGALGEGHGMMLLWRLASKLEMDPSQFEALLSASGGAGSP